MSAKPLQDRLGLVTGSELLADGGYSALWTRIRTGAGP